jgi:CRP-like cAMP-binding protein
MNAKEEPADDASELLLSSRFADLPEPLVRELVKRGERRTYGKGAFVHRKGDAGDGLFRILSGRVRVSTTTAEGTELVLIDHEPGSFFGELSVFDGLPRTHDAYALDRCELIFVDRRAIEVILETSPDLARHFLRALALKVRISLMALDGVALRPVSERLALRLFLLAKQSGASSPPFEIAVSQSDLASMVGATRQSINKDLKRWEREGLVRLEGRKLLVLDDAALFDVANR